MDKQKEIEEMSPEEIDDLTKDPFIDAGFAPDPVETICLWSPTDVLNVMGEERKNKTLFRDKTIREICAILLSESKPNALLIGPAGSGKTNIVEELATRIRGRSRDIPKALYGYEICSLNISDIVAGSEYVGKLENKVRQLVSHLETRRRTILFLDEVHVLFRDEDCYRGIAQMLKPAISRGKFKVIAATTTQESRKLDTDPAFNRRFTKVPVDELTKEQTQTVLMDAVRRMERHFGARIRFNESLAELVVSIADEFCDAGSHRPDNALTLLDRTVASMIVERQAKGLSVDCINLDAGYIERTAIRLTSGNSMIKPFDERAFREALSRIRGQDDILDDLTETIKLYDLHLRPRNKPLTFLFAGPSGVGKTEVTKILAREYVGESPIILNMAEYFSDASINRIIGSPDGYVDSDSNRELPFDALETNPYQVILLDEFEKCHTSVQRLFLSVFDEGIMVTNRGKVIDFTKAIIVATTNAGCTSGTGHIGFGREDDANDLSVVDLSAFFDTELINRFSHRYTFHGISKGIYRQIIKDTLEREVKSLNLDRAGLQASEKLKAQVSDETAALLCEKSYNEKQGARPAETIVRGHIDALVLSLMTAQKSVNVTNKGQRPKTHRQYIPAVTTHNARL